MDRRDVCREKRTTSPKLRYETERQRARENEEASLRASNPREAPGYPSAPLRNLFLMKWRFPLFLSFSCARATVFARFSGNLPKSFVATATLFFEPAFSLIRKDVGVRKQESSWEESQESSRDEEDQPRNTRDVYVRMAFIYFPFFERSLFETTCAPGQFREFREVVGAHTSGNGDGGMVDNIMMASAGRGGAGLRGDQYYPPPPPLPFPRPCISLSPFLPRFRSPCYSYTLRLTFPQTPSRVSPPMRPPSPSPPYECQVALPSTATRGFLLWLVLRRFSISFFPFHLPSNTSSHKMGKIVNLDAQKRKETTISRYVWDIYISCVYVCAAKMPHNFFQFAYQYRVKEIILLILSK